MGYSSVPYDKLIAGMVQPIVTQSIIIEQDADAQFERGTVLARTGFDTDGTWICTIVDSAAAEDSGKIPVGILADDEVDASEADARATAYVQGEFNRDALIFGGTDTIATHEAALNDAKIYTKRVVE
ncbi:head decoration protein [Paenibacillus camelliae]|uniref:head decoration protein n=1 Tax=Paenibacillus camelliae TaxID=512410 RepID=UPI00203DB05B|nr:head decoration protein [Paenibacillus camelliae]MCM3632941.1 head decoration protein [Paenibacillus camelliae]